MSLFVCHVIFVYNLTTRLFYIYIFLNDVIENSYAYAKHKIIAYSCMLTKRT